MLRPSNRLDEHNKKANCDGNRFQDTPTRTLTFGRIHRIQYLSRPQIWTCMYASYAHVHVVLELPDAQKTTEIELIHSMVGVYLLESFKPRATPTIQMSFLRALHKEGICESIDNNCSPSPRSGIEAIFRPCKSNGTRVST